MQSSTMRVRVAVDTGGTFTDFVVLDESSGALDVFKVPSTRGAEADGIIAGLRQFLERTRRAGADVAFFSHGTTVGTNAILEEKGAKTGLLVTKGFRGVYEVGEQSRPHGPYDLFYRKPHPLVRPRSTFEIGERISFDGSVYRPLDEATVRDAARRIRNQGIRSVAVCLLFSFRNPTHERRVAEILAEELPDCNVSLSCDVVPQIREYFRLSTTLVNAYLNPLLEGYVEALDERLAQLGTTTDQRYIMRSNGGVASFGVAAQRSVQTILSGPAAGVVAAEKIAELLPDHRNVVTFDMGGTSTDVALIENGTPTRRSGGKVHDRYVLVPMLDIHTVAAGGGTIAYVDANGTLHVGPQSAGAIPGPVAYGRGGTQPTVTDANLVLGYLSDGNALAGGTLGLDKAAAARAIERLIAKPLGLSVIEAARGIIEIVNVKMEQAIKVVSSNRGFDLREFHVLAFGGAGPLHGAAMAEDLGMKGVLVPPFPGVTSALGLLLSDVRHDYVVSDLRSLDDISPADVNATFARMRADAERELIAEGFSADVLTYEYDLDMRYVGQGYDLTVRVRDVPLDADGLRRVRADFDQQHLALTGHAAPDAVAEIVNYRVTGVALVPKADLAAPFAARGSVADAYAGEREAYFDATAPVATKLYERAKLPFGATIDGPAILVQADSTTVVPPGHRARVIAFDLVEIVHVASEP
jgi:N-methylhydantoinase A